MYLAQTFVYTRFSMNPFWQGNMDGPLFVTCFARHRNLGAEADSLYGTQNAY